MGADIYPDGKPYIPGISQLADNDYILKTSSKSNSLYYIYMKRSKNVWQIEKNGSITTWGNKKSLKDFF